MVLNVDNGGRAGASQESQDGLVRTEQDGPVAHPQSVDVRGTDSAELQRRALRIRNSEFAPTRLPWEQFATEKMHLPKSLCQRGVSEKASTDFELFSYDVVVEILVSRKAKDNSTAQ